ncbi:MAG: glycosyltransferase [Candidatus Nanopelagicales bacterium]
MSSKPTDEVGQEEDGEEQPVFGWRMTAEMARPRGDGRRSVLFVFNQLKPDAGRLTQLWLARVRAFVAADWQTHIALINRDPALPQTLSALRRAGKLPSAAQVHHFPERDRRLRPEAWASPPPGESIDPVVTDWLDYLSEYLPGAAVFVDSPAAYPCVAAMHSPLISKIAGIHLNHLNSAQPGEAPDLAAFTPRFAERFANVAREFDALVVMTAAQAADLRGHFGADLPVVVIPAWLPMRESAIPPTAPAEPLIVSVGQLEPSARHAHVIRALPAVRKVVPAARVEIQGVGSNREQLLALAASLGVGGAVAVRAPEDPAGALPAAAVCVWPGKRDSTPISLVRALGAGIPVVAYDLSYGPAELVDPGVNGVLVAGGDIPGLAAGIVDALTSPQLGANPRERAATVRAEHSDAAVWRRWQDLGAQLEDQRWDRRAPTVLTSAVISTDRVFRLPGSLINAEQNYTQWYVRMPSMRKPVGFLSDPRVRGSWNTKRRETDQAPNDELIRGVIVHLRSDSLAFVAVRTQEEHVLEMSVALPGPDNAPPEYEPDHVVAKLLSYPFEPVLLVSRAGSAVMFRNPDATIGIRPLDKLIWADAVDGRVHARLDETSQPTDATHAISWAVDIDWSDISVTDGGAAFTGVLRARRIAPHPGSIPAICVRDVGGYSRVVGQLEFRSTPTIDEEGTWLVPVGGVIRTDPLVATTQIARGALALHVGLRGLLHPVGGLWIHGHRSSHYLQCERGGVTLLPSPGGRVLAAPGRGVRARTLGTLKRMLGRTGPGPEL